MTCLPSQDPVASSEHKAFVRCRAELAVVGAGKGCSIGAVDFVELEAQEVCWADGIPWEGAAALESVSQRRRVPYGR